MKSISFEFCVEGSTCSFIFLSGIVWLRQSSVLLLLTTEGSQEINKTYFIWYQCDKGVHMDYCVLRFMIHCTCVEGFFGKLIGLLWVHSGFKVQNGRGIFMVKEQGRVQVNIWERELLQYSNGTTWFLLNSVYWLASSIQFQKFVWPDYGMRRVEENDTVFMLWNKGITKQFIGRLVIYIVVIATKSRLLLCNCRILEHNGSPYLTFIMVDRAEIKFYRYLERVSESFSLCFWYGANISTDVSGIFFFIWYVSFSHGRGLMVKSLLWLRVRGGVPLREQALFRFYLDCFVGI